MAITAGFLKTGEGATFGGILVNISLTLLKVAVGVAGHSSALIADALHSLSDLASDVIVLLGYRVGQAPGDQRHPYGHGKIETLCTLVVGSMLIAVGIGMGWAAVDALRGEAKSIPGLSALGAAAVSIVVKELLYRITARAAKDTGSKLLLANAWHHRSDAFSSIAALIGVGGAILGAPWMDPAAAAVVCIFVVKVGTDLGWSATQDLIDATVDDDLMERIKNTVMSVSGIAGCHGLKARRLGKDIIVDVDIEVDPGLNVVQGHELSRQVRLALFKNVKHVRDAMVHIEPTGARDGGFFAEENRKQLLDVAEKIAKKADGVKGVHGIRLIPLESRGYLVNMDIEVSPSLTLGEAHEIAHQIKQCLREQTGIVDAVIHMDVEPE